MRRSIRPSGASFAVTGRSTTAPKNMSALSSGTQTRSKITSRFLKRGIIGTYHHVSETHLHRYGAEFDFRYNHRVALGYSDRERTTIMLQNIVGKRLTYRRTGERAHQQA